MTELLVPELADRPFREHYRSLIVVTMLRSAEAWQEESHSRQAERAVAMLREVSPAEVAAAHALLPERLEYVEALVAPEPVPELVPEPEPVAEPPAESTPGSVPEAAAPEPEPVFDSEPWPVLEPAAEPALAAVEEAGDPPLIVPVLVSEGSWFSPRVRIAARVLWFVALGLLICDVAVFGVASWATGAADLGLLSLTMVWFVVGIDDLVASPKRHTPTLD